MPYRCLIIGLGQIGMGYDLDSPQNAIFTHSRAFSAHPSFEIAGAVDPSVPQRSTFEKLFGKPTFKDIPSAIKELEFEVVVISSPTAFHSMHVRIVLSLSKPLAILCEKPLAYDLAEAKEIVQICNGRSVKLYVNYMRRSDPGVIEIKKRITTGQIANPIKGTVWYSKGFIHNGSHFFNLMQFWLGSYQQHSILCKGRLWKDVDPEPDVYVEFERGKIVFLSAWEESFSHYTAELVSPSGRLRYDRGGELIQWQNTVIDSCFLDYTILTSEPEIIPNGMSQYQYHVADQLALELEGIDTSLCSGHEAFDTIKVIHEIIDL